MSTRPIPQSQLLCHVWMEPQQSLSSPVPWLSPSLSLLGASAHHPWVLDLTGPCLFPVTTAEPTFPYKILTAQRQKAKVSGPLGLGRWGVGESRVGHEGLRGCTS